MQRCSGDSPRIPRFLGVLVVLAVAAVATEPAPSVAHFPEDVDLNATIDRFQRWFSDGYGPALGVRLGPAGDGMRIGVFATKPIAPESIYLSIPRHIIIDDATIFPSETVGPVLKAMARDHFPASWRPQLTLGMFLLHQRFVARDASFWKPYIDLLPTAHDSPAFFTEAERVRYLSGLPVLRASRAVQQEFVQVYRLAVRAVQEMQKRDPRVVELFPSWALNEANWAWVHGILNSRQIWWDGGPHFVPMLDMINCRQGPAGYERRVHSTFRTGDTASTRAPWRFAAGDQVFENYGQPNPTYFLYHGFVMEPNVHDCAKMTWTTNRKARHSADDGRGFTTVATDPARVRKAMEIGAWADEICVSKSQLDPLLRIARVMAARSPNALRTATDAARPLADAKQERKALKLAGRAVRVQVSLLPPVPWNATAGDLAFNLEDIGRHRAARQRWATSDVVAGMAFRERMSILYRESQRQLLLDVAHEISQRLRATRPPVRPPTAPDEL